MKTSVMILILLAAFGTTVDAAENPQRPLRVAFVLSERFAMIDFAGPWEVFSDTTLPGTSAPERPAYDLYTVSSSAMPVHSEGGALLVPKFTLTNAPRPDLIIIGAQTDRSPSLLAWLRQEYADGVTLASICTGADQLATAGLLDGRKATTHHDYIAPFRKRFPRVEWLEGRRFVQNGARLYTAGGLTSGVDLALYLVSEHFGRPAAIKTAGLMEYLSDAWRASTTP
jgi:transcriptional regulator GlxA family with amidase domain